MQLLIFLVGGVVLLMGGILIRRRQPRTIAVQDVMNLVFIAFGAAYAFAEGVLPSVWLAASIGAAQLRGQPTDNLQAHLMPGTNIGDLVRSAVVGTIIAQVFAVKAYIDACRGVPSRSRLKSRTGTGRTSRR